MEVGKKMLRFMKGMKGGKDDPQALADEAADVVISLAQLCNDAKIDLDVAVPRKFNETSDKYGFSVKLPVPGEVL